MKKWSYIFIERKRLVKCFVWSVALYGAETWTLRRNEQKRLEVFKIWMWKRMENDAVVLERVGEGRIMSLVRKELPAEWCSRRNGKREEGSRQKEISDDRQHYDKWTVCRYEKEGCEECRVENAEFLVKDLPLGRTLWLTDWAIDWLIFIETRNKKSLYKITVKGFIINL